MIVPVEVEDGDNFYVLADRLAPTANRDLAAEYLWRANGYPTPIFGGQVLWYNTAAAELAPVTEPAPVTGRPDATNTGHSGGLSAPESGTDITTQGAVIEGRHFTGRVNVEADNVTFRNCLFSGGVYGIYNGIFESAATSGLVVEDCEFTGQSSAGFVVSNATIRRCYIHDQGKDGIKPWRDVTVEGCYITRMGVLPTEAHCDGLQMVVGGRVVVRGCNIDMPYDEPGFQNSQCIIIQSNDGPVDDILIEGNWINGGGYSVQINDKGTGHGGPTNVRVINNRFGRDFLYGPLRFRDTVPADRSGNVWDDTDEPI